MLSNSPDNTNLDTNLAASNSLLPDASTEHNLFGMTVSDTDSLMLSPTPETIVQTEAMAMHSMTDADGGTMMQADIAGQNSSHNMGGHQTFLDLVPHEAATHVAIKNGHWFNPSTWQNGQVPGDDADVLIPKGRIVWYTEKSEARLDTLRVDGTLGFASKRNTKMLIDTFVVSPIGKLQIGLENRPIEAHKTTEIIFTSDTEIDTQLDPKQFGRGLISHGQAEIYGAEKLDFVALQKDALKGDNELILDLPEGQTAPLGWKIGDQLVVGGTSYNHHADDSDNSRYHDEVLTISAINGDRIRFTNNDLDGDRNDVLRFNHQRPEGFEDELNLYVANTTRNVSFSTENGSHVPVNHRGHVMFMHNPDVVVQNAGFYDLGRTDKNRLLDDPFQNVDGSVGTGKNPRGRYALHFHKTGLDDPNSAPALALGNAVVGSPGWGLVHHASNAVFEDNVVFDVVGAGIVAEAGNELGAWRNNITIKTTGDDRRNHLDFNSPREYLFDFGFNGEGYWVQGAAQVEMSDNIAISSGAGVGFFASDQGSEHLREAQTIPVAHLPTALQDIARGTEDPTVIDVSGVPLRKLSGFESYNSGVGILSWGHMENRNGELNFSFGSGNKPRPAHNYRSLINDFKLWNMVGNGIGLKYSSNIDLKDGLILGKPQRKDSTGVRLNDSSNRLSFSNLRIENFVNGINVAYDAGKNYVGSKIEGSYFARNVNNFAPTNAHLVIKPGTEDFPEFFEIGKNNTFAPDNLKNNIAPKAKFSSQAAGGLARTFDASQSFDPDSELLPKSSKGIVSYGWDFDNDGNVDKFGREVSHHFDRAGDRKVTLTVWDSQGTSSNLEKIVNVKQTAYQNAFVDGGFDSQKSFGLPGQTNSVFSDSGWLGTPGLQYGSSTSDKGTVVLIGEKYYSSIAQIVQDDWIRRGKQTFSIDIKNTADTTKSYGKNQMKLEVWGVDGEFKHNLAPTSDPAPAGALPLASHKLLDETIEGFNFDQKNFSWDLDLNKGYQFLMVKVSGTRTGNLNDYVEIDNIQLK